MTTLRDLAPLSPQKSAGSGKQSVYTCTYIYVCISDDRGRCVVSFQISGKRSICISIGGTREFLDATKSIFPCIYYVKRWNLYRLKSQRANFRTDRKDNLSSIFHIKITRSNLLIRCYVLNNRSNNTNVCKIYLRNTLSKRFRYSFTWMARSSYGTFLK